jgi:hypothetical protein
MLVISRVTSAQLAEGPYCRPNSGEAVDPAEGVGQPVAACHAADQIRGLVAGHPGGRDIHGPGGAFPPRDRHGVGGHTEGCLGYGDDRYPELGIRLGAQAGTAAGVQVGVAVDDQQLHAVQTVQDRVQRRQFAQVELAGLVRRHLGHLPGAVGQQMTEGGIGGHDSGRLGSAAGQIVHVHGDEHAPARPPTCLHPPKDAPPPPAAAQ